jgi:subtilase family serine protease
MRRLLRLRLCRFEALEPRQVLSSSGLTNLPAIEAHPFAHRVSPMASPFPVGHTPAEIQKAYGFDQISFLQRSSNGKYSTLSGNALGKGMTIAIVDAYNNPSIMSDIQVFSQQFGLPQFNKAGGPTFKIINQNGNSSPLPKTEATALGIPTTGWAGEIALDVEWVHAIAPSANIVLVLATDNLTTNLLKAVDTARHLPGVVAVSNSWGSTAVVQVVIDPVTMLPVPDGFGRLVPISVASEFLGEGIADSVFTTPAGHQGVSFIASAGDDGGPAAYPSSSPNILSVGGTTLTLDPIDGSWTDEIVWNNAIGAGGGGQSGVMSRTSPFVTDWSFFPIEPVPNYQRSLGLIGRGTPDVSYDADPVTGFATYSSYALQGWASIGGTSAGAPQWAALIAIANQGRKLKGRATLSNVQSIIYKLPSTDFHDITVGNNDFLSQQYSPSGLGLGLTGNAATDGYDLASGRGTPLANLVVRDLVNFTGSTFVASTRAPSTNTPGSFYFFGKGTRFGASASSMFAGPGLPGGSQVKSSVSADGIAGSIDVSVAGDSSADGTLTSVATDSAASVTTALSSTNSVDPRETTSRRSNKFSSTSTCDTDAADVEFERLALAVRS